MTVKYDLGDFKMAILFFTRTAKVEAMAKIFSAHGASNLNLIRSLICHTRSELQKSGYDYFEVDETMQEGADFAEKLNNAFDKIFSLGYERVVAIGNDCPSNDATNLKLALQNWSADCPLLTGKTQRGGVYLLVLTQDAFEKINFKKLHWQSEYLYSDLVAYCRNLNLGVFETSGLSEVNELKDFSTFNIQKLSFAIFRIYSEVCKALVRIIEIKMISALSPDIIAPYADRGPPRTSQL